MSESSSPGSPASGGRFRPGDVVEAQQQHTASSDSNSGSESGIKEQATQAATSATQESKHVAAVAGQEAQELASEVGEHAKALLDDARAQLEDQTRNQRDQLADTLRTFCDDLESMASGRTGLAADLARQAASKARGFSGSVENREPAELLDSLRTFARNRPGTFLLGAMAAGLVTGRMMRGAKESASNGQGDGEAASFPAQGGSAAGMEPAPTASADLSGIAAGNPATGVAP